MGANVKSFFEKIEKNYDLSGENVAAEMMIFCLIHIKKERARTRVLGRLDSGMTYDQEGESLKMAAKWYIKTYVSRNGIEERTKFCVRSEETGRKAVRAARRAARRADNAERQLGRVLNNNFIAGEDRHIVLEFTDAMLIGVSERATRALTLAHADAGIINNAASGEDGTDIGETSDKECALRRDATPGASPRPTDKPHGPQEGELRDAMLLEARRELSLFIRRARRECAKLGIPLKLAAAASDMDGATGDPARLHIHMVVNAEAAEVCRRKWRGEAWERELYNVRGDLFALASYIIRQTRPIEGSQAYTVTRNLDKPLESEPVELVGAAAKYAESEMRVPRGCYLLYRSTYARGSAQYIRYLRPRRE